MSGTSREVHLVSRPTGAPTAENFAMVEVRIPDPGPGEVLVRNDWMSVDPGMRGRMRDVPSYIPPFRLGVPLEAAIDSMRDWGRVAMCGSVSQYNKEKPAPGPANLGLVTRKRLTLKGFIVMDHPELREEWLALARQWLEDGSFVSATTVTDGLEHAAEALSGVLEGANVGKMLVRINPEAD